MKKKVEFGKMKDEIQHNKKENVKLKDKVSMVLNEYPPSKFFSYYSLSNVLNFTS